MARYRDARCRICRREGEKLFLRGRRCYSDKCSFIKRGFPPGMHGRTGRRRITPYGFQLREKQKLKMIYGVLEGQFRRFYNLAAKQGNPGENLIILLERRLDNVVYRLGFASSRPQARQLVRHRHILVNGRTVDIPSYLVEVGDEIAISERMKKNKMVLDALEERDPSALPEWLNLNQEELIGRIVRFPKRDEIQLPVEEQQIVELYSK
ncbi:30S ribosomal protein S4 [candidate division WOR-3 bacterium]|uniref:Small ribosomal subunit protein uS4 n=1 Tax=candidate division WOR-3 bacterium TaxID=2052148 RepID=A0A660SE19_UNCW3|nr:MAG: 30S ribosomal protein S4 [candidate division WOR-3 bacterium]